MIDDACSWDRPGVNAYSGSPRAAIMALAHVPQNARLSLVMLAEANWYKDQVEITRDRITGDGAYADHLGYMAFGTGRVCKTVTRHRWTADDVQRALVFCADEWCVARPSVCNNWSIVTRLDQVTLQPVVPLQTVRIAQAASAASAPVVHTVPEPTTLALVALALAGLMFARRKG